MNNIILGIVGLTLLMVVLTGLDLWRLYRRRHKAALQIDVPGGRGEGASVKFMGHELHGVECVTFHVCAGGAAECVLHIHPSMVKIFADSMELKLEGLDIEEEESG